MIKTLLQKTWSLIKNKFILTLSIFFVWLLVFDQQNLVDRWTAKKHLSQLKQDTSYYYNKIIKDQESINLLETSKDNLEKFARERYLMKSPDEDVYIIVKK